MTMYRSSFSMFALLALLSSSRAQTEVHQVLVLNEGYYDFNTQMQMVPVTLGSYDPLGMTYQTVATITGARFATDVQVHDGAIYVAADDQLLKYDPDTYQLLGQAAVTGIRKLAFWNDQVLITRGESGGLDHYFEVRDATTLDPVYSIDPAGGLIHSAEDVEVLGDKAYLAVNNAFDWDDLVGYVGIIDLQTQSYMGSIDLGPDGLDPEHIMVAPTGMYVLNNKDFTSSSISRVDPAGEQLLFTQNVALSSGCGASALGGEKIYFMEYAVGHLARWDLTTEQVADTLPTSPASYGLIADPVNEVLYATTTDFTTTGDLHVLDPDGNEITSVAVGVAPGNLALDLRAANGIAGTQHPALQVHPTIAEDLVQVDHLRPGQRYEVIDTAGRKLATYTATPGGTWQIDVSGFAAGTFLLCTEGRDVGRFVKR